MKTKSLLDQDSAYATIANEASTTTIDLKPILEECMGEMDLLQELISLFHENALEFIGAAKIHQKNSDFKSLGLAAHKIKAGLAMMRTDGLHSIIVMVQNECDETTDAKHLQFLCDCFASEYPLVLHSIDEALVSLKKA